MKTIVIYHRADFDGIFCREIARKFLPEGTEFIGWDYGDPVPTPDVVSADDTVYMLDISIDGLMDHPKLIWIDHHKSAIDKYGLDAYSYCIDGVAACRLTWQYFYTCNSKRNFIVDDGWELPKKEDYVNRKVQEPWAVRLAGEYDIWDKRDPNAELFQHGLRSCNLDDLWPFLLKLDTRLLLSEIERLLEEGHSKDLLSPDGTTPNPTVRHLLARGEAIQYAKTQENKGIIEAYGYDVEFEGLQFLACNHARFNSHLFTAKIKPHHEGLLGFNWTGKYWRVSLYGVPGKPDIDLSKIAVKHGGGGHKQACGFTAPWLPFIEETHLTNG